MNVRSSIVISTSAIALAMSVGVLADQRVFVSSQTNNGNMGGLAGADAICRNLADTAALGGVWVAWLSDSTTDARDRIVGGGPFIRMDGAHIAEDRADLLDGTLNVPVGLTEYGNSPPQDVVVTGTKGDGTKKTGADLAFCGDWNSSEPYPPQPHPPVGFASYLNSGWTYAGGGDCSFPLLLYCFESLVDLIFADDFELGTTGSWSYVVP